MALTADRLARDIDFTLGHAGVSVVHGSAQVSGVLETVDEVVLPDAEVLGTRLTVVVRAAALSGVRVGDAITVDGTSYSVRDHRREGDGVLMRIFLALP